MTEHAVVVAGGGPTGLMLAAELALAGVDVAIVERRASQDLPGSRGDVEPIVGTRGAVADFRRGGL
jgi:2-polyprenyl-6-methoxyphenol hydroxylase-like FAD-dependent oxidoreductase